MRQLKEKQALKLALEALEKLWNIIDDIDTYNDMAKADEKLYRALVERRQRTRFEETGISTDGYELTGGAITAIKEALAQPQQEPQRKPLSDEEIYSLADSLEIWNEDDEEWILDPNTFARAIEAAHGIKENT